jgi:hypothetical protein
MKNKFNKMKTNQNNEGQIKKKNNINFDWIMKLKTDQIITKGTRRKIKKNKNQNEKKKY